MPLHFFICPRCGFRDLINVPEENTRPRLTCRGKCERISLKAGIEVSVPVNLDMTEVSMEQYDASV